MIWDEGQEGDHWEDDFLNYLTIANSEESAFKLHCTLVPLFPEFKHGLNFVFLFRTFVLL